MILGIEAQSSIIEKIKNINSLRLLDERVDEMINYKETLRASFNDELDELFANVNLRQEATEEDLKKKINVLSVAFTDEEQSLLDYEHQCSFVEKKVSELYWYDKEILDLYIRLGSYRAIEKETGIPFESCYSTVRKIAKKIRSEFKPV